MRYRNLLALLLLIAWLYGSVLKGLFLEWVGPHSDPNFQHGIAVPFFALFVLWQGREQLAAIRPAPSWTGLPLVALSMLLLVLGVLGADIFLPRVSLLILLAGLIILFRGWTFFRAVLFPWAFLFLMIPIPVLLLNRVTFPLQLVAAKWAASLLELVGVPVLLEGNLLTLASMPLNVSEACSGIRSLLTLVTLAIIYGYLLETRKWVRVVLVCAAVPIAVAANSFRVFGTGVLVQLGYDKQAEGFYHTVTGMVIFVPALIMLLALHRVISLIWKNGPVASPSKAHAGQLHRLAMHAQSATLLFGIGVATMLATAIFLQAHSHAEIIPQRQPLSSFPSLIDGWQATDGSLSEDELKVLGYPEYLLLIYKSANQPQGEEVSLYVLYFPSQKGRRHDPLSGSLPPGCGMDPDFA